MKGKFSFWTICRLKRFSLVGFFLPLIIKALFEVAYANSFSVLFGYLGAKYNQTAYSALVNGSTVCAGYSKAFQLLMTKLGIPTYYVVGISKEENLT